VREVALGYVLVFKNQHCVVVFVQASVPPKMQDQLLLMDSECCFHWQANRCQRS